MNITISWIANQENFLITNISFSWRMLIVVYSIIIVIFLKHQKNRFFWICLSILFMILTLIYEKQKVSSREELIIFNNHRNTTLGYLKKQNLKVYSTERIRSKTQHFLFSNYLIHNHADLDTNYLQLKNIYQYKQHIIMIIDSASVYQIKNEHSQV